MQPPRGPRGRVRGLAEPGRLRARDAQARVDVAQRDLVLGCLSLLVDVGRCCRCCCCCCCRCRSCRCCWCCCSCRSSSSLPLSVSLLLLLPPPLPLLGLRLVRRRCPWPLGRRHVDAADDADASHRRRMGAGGGGGGGGSGSRRPSRGRNVVRRRRRRRCCRLLVDSPPLRGAAVAVDLLLRLRGHSLELELERRGDVRGVVVGRKRSHVGSMERSNAIRRPLFSRALFVSVCAHFYRSCSTEDEREKERDTAGAACQSRGGGAREARLSGEARHCAREGETERVFSLFFSPSF